MHANMAIVFAGLFLAAMIRCEEKCFAESAGELGLHYGVRYPQPIVIGPLRDMLINLRQPPPKLESETPDTDTPLTDQSFDFLNPDQDFDENLYVARDYDDLYTLLHKKGGRFSYQISPLMRIPFDQFNKKDKKTRKKVIK